MEGRIFWLTGLSGAGKSTIARLAEKELLRDGYRVVVLDGDLFRQGLNKDLGFSPEDRKENLRRIREVSKILANEGMTVISAVISPYEEDRSDIQSMPNGHVVYVNTSLENCIQRDVKGLYKKALNGEIKNFTGISAPYEVPAKPDLIINTNSTPDESAMKLVEFIKQNGKG